MPPALQTVPDFDKFELIKVYTATISYTASSGQAESPITHGLGYVPMILAYVNSSGQVYQPFNFTVIDPAGAILEYFDCYTTPTQAVVRVTIPTTSSVYGSNFSTDVKVLLFRTKADQ